MRIQNKHQLGTLMVFLHNLFLYCVSMICREKPLLVFDYMTLANSYRTTTYLLESLTWFIMGTTESLCQNAVLHLLAYLGLSEDRNQKRAIKNHVWTQLVGRLRESSLGI